MIVLDTDHLSLLEWREKQQTQRLQDRLDQSGEVVFATIVSFEEQSRGWLAKIAAVKTAKDLVEAYRRLLNHLENYRAIGVLPFDEIAATEYQRLRKLKLRIGTMDLRIAAIAMTRRAKLLSKNRADFTNVPGLVIEDWTV